MKTIKYRFYSARAAAKDGRKMSLVEKLIDLRSELTHVETQFDENRGFISWSSTGAEGANGCRFRDIGYSHNKYWLTLSFVVTDEEESRLWNFCCEMANLAYDWQSKPYGSCTFTATIKEGQDVFASYVKDNTNYQGIAHVKYDYIGLLTFALEKSPSWKTNFLRGLIWGWTAVIKPDPNAAWCSEACSKGWNVMRSSLVFPTVATKNLLNCFWPMEIDPGEMYQQMLKMKGVTK